MKLNIRALIIVFAIINIMTYSGLVIYVTTKDKTIIASAKAEKINIPKVITQIYPRLNQEIIDPAKGNHFPFGQCTWYVATKRNILWNGNAIDWYRNAQIFGRTVGTVPKKGAILVTRESYYGHVAYVESVNGNYFEVSEMNNPTWGKVTRRILTKGQIPLVGFIY